MDSQQSQQQQNSSQPQTGADKDKDIDVSLTNLKKWLESNVPKNTRIEPNEDPIISKPSAATRVPDADPAPASANGNAR